MELKNTKHLLLVNSFEGRISQVHARFSFNILELCINTLIVIDDMEVKYNPNFAVADSHRYNSQSHRFKAICKFCFRSTRLFCAAQCSSHRARRESDAVECRRGFTLHLSTEKHKPAAKNTGHSGTCQRLAECRRRAKKIPTFHLRLQVILVALNERLKAFIPLCQHGGVCVSRTGPHCESLMRPIELSRQLESCRSVSLLQAKQSRKMVVFLFR